MEYLKRDIKCQILNNIYVGLDSPPGPPAHRRSLNHTMKLSPLVQGGQTRLSMENQVETNLGHVGLGILTVKFTKYQGATAGVTTMETPLPWKPGTGVRTFQDYVRVVGHYRLHQYEMTASHKGCRFHAKGLTALEIGAYMTHLSVKNESLGWDDSGLQGEKLREKIAELSKRRSDWYFERYFNLNGEDREVPEEQGRFFNEIPKGQAMRAWAEELQYKESNPMEQVQKQLGQK
ncbi:MAG: hypothetical protein Q9163_000193 [Psora crenata]